MLCRLSVKPFVIYIFFGFCLWQVQSRYSYAAGQPTVQHSTKFQYNQQQTDADSLAKQVTIKRTKHGVPHIEAENMRAAGFALGYVQMEDYGGKVTNGLIRARGEWAKYHEVDTDKLNDVLDSDAANRRKYARAVETWQYLEKDTRDITKGFVEGINYYVKLHMGEFDDWVKPFFTIYDIHARSITGPSSSSIRQFLNALKRRQSQNDEIATASSSPAKSSFYGKKATVWSRLAARTKEPHPDVGSNAWALAPSRTTSGNAILLRNPHLSWGAGYYEAHIKVPGKLNFYGDFRIGRPIAIIGGFNKHLGWATTNNNPDLDEIYAFKADPERPDHFLLDGGSVPITKETVTVEFENGKSLGQEHREFLSTPFGPVIHRGNGKVYVIKSAGDGGFRMGEQFLRMMKAQNLSEWKEAMRIRARTSSNLTYADVEGNIFYVWNASTPELPHPSGRDTLAIHVSSADEIWTDLYPWDKLPQLRNPEGGYLHNENDPFHFTNLNEIFDADNFPDYFPEPRFRLRSQLSYELVHGDQKFSLKDIITLKHSMRMLLADRVKSDLVRAVKKSEPSDETSEALRLIDEWDNTVAKDSRGGVLFKTWWWRYVDQANPKGNVESTPESAGFSARSEALFSEPWSPDKPVETPRGLGNPNLAAEAFTWAVKETKDRYGAWNVAWGDVHRARIGNLDVRVGGCGGVLGCFRVLWFTEYPNNSQKLQVTGGDGWVLAVEFGEIPSAYSVLAYGESNKVNSPYFNDQLQMFADNKMKRISFTEKDIQKQLIQEYQPGQEKK